MFVWSRRKLVAVKIKNHENVLAHWTKLKTFAIKDYFANDFCKDFWFAVAEIINCLIHFAVVTFEVVLSERVDDCFNFLSRVFKAQKCRFFFIDRRLRGVEGSRYQVHLLTAIKLLRNFKIYLKYHISYRISF